MENKHFHIDKNKEKLNDYFVTLMNVIFLVAIMICAVLFFWWLMELLKQISIN
ncbi:MAG: hypothetical protein R2807_00380 [Chitinophagales bacterium]